MMSMTLGQVSKPLNAVVIGGDASFTQVSTDTRSIHQGDLFVALKGPNFDGHEYLQQAADKGAVAAMVSHELPNELPQLRVRDTRLGLGQLARVWRQQVNPRVIALTGSNGKTTLKEMLAAVLSQPPEARVLATTGNLNNDIGVPLTLLRLQDHDFAVIEMGANHVGEIDYLSRMALPDIAILNNAGRAHIGEFGSEENIARAKAEIINGLDEEGVFIYNLDSPWRSLWESLAKGRNTGSFGLSADADVYSPEKSYSMIWHEQGFSSRFEVCLDGQCVTFELHLAGRHNRMNALAAIAAAWHAGIPLRQIHQGLLSLKPVKGRLCPSRDPEGRLLIDDSYNANPDSVKAGLEVLSQAPGRKILVLGDMAELGAQQQHLHADMGLLANQSGIDCVYTCGSLSQATAASFSSRSKHFTHQTDLIDTLMKETGPGDVLLIKGSRSAAMENVVHALMGAEESIC